MCLYTIPAGTLGGSREPLNWFSEFDPAALKFLDVSSTICLLSYKARADCVLGGIVLERTVDLQKKRSGCINIFIGKTFTSKMLTQHFYQNSIARSLIQQAKSLPWLVLVNLTLEGRHAFFPEEALAHFYHHFPQDKQIPF